MTKAQPLTLEEEAKYRGVAKVMPDGLMAAFFASLDEARAQSQRALIASPEQEIAALREALREAEDLRLDAVAHMHAGPVDEAGIRWALDAHGLPSHGRILDAVKAGLETLAKRARDRGIEDAAQYVESLSADDAPVAAALRALKSATPSIGEKIAQLAEHGAEAP